MYYVYYGNSVWAGEFSVPMGGGGGGGGFFCGQPKERKKSSSL